MCPEYMCMMMGEWRWSGDEKIQVMFILRSLE